MSSDKRVTRAVYGVYIVVTAAFVVANVYSVGSALFGGAASGAAGPRVSPACAAALSELTAAVDEARAEAERGAPGEAAAQRYEAAKAQTFQRYDALARPCASDPNGTDALAALARFERATARAVRRQSSELGSVRREVDSFIR